MQTKNPQNWRKLTKEQQLALMEKGKQDAEAHSKQKPSPYTQGGR